MNTKTKKGIWLIGAYGDIATTLIVGKEAIQHNLTSNIGLVSELEPMNQLDLCALSDFIIGGHDIIEMSVPQQAEIICERSRTFSFRILNQIKTALEAVEKNIVTAPEMHWDTNQETFQQPSLTQLCTQFRGMLKEFIATHQLDHVTVVNLASAEVFTPRIAAHNELVAFEKLLAEDNKAHVSPSMLFAYAAFKEHCSFVNFTPNISASIGALEALAVQQSVPFCGDDGKTGETLLKTSLAPMFAARHLKVMSWEATNMLGNGDGVTLDKPENCKNKILNKAAVLPGILGYTPHSNVDIKYVPSLGDWKMAWDMIHFKGFLDVPMQMQFTWQGCDSILAAPLTLDLIRFTELAHRNGESGALKHLACFFKNPAGVNEHDFFKQFELLLKYTYAQLEV